MTDIQKEVISALNNILTTTDKRYMFLKMEFPHVIPYINLEGSPNNVSTAIVSEFIRRGLVNKLINILNNKFNYKILQDVE